MKKMISKLIILLVLFIPSFVKADSQCYYKTDDGKIDMVVNVDNNGKAKGYLMKGYSTTDGFKENQQYSASWNVSNWTGSCPSYLKFQISTGSNSLDASNTAPTLGADTYSLKKYDFSSNSSTCEYTINGTSKVTYRVAGNSVAYFWDNILATSPKTANSSGKVLLSNFSDLTNVIHNVSTQKCPQFWVNETNGQYRIHQGSNTSGTVIPVENTKASFSSTSDKDSEVASCSYMIAKGDSNEDIFVKFKKFSKAGYKFCVQRSGTYSNEACDVVSTSTILQLSVTSKFTLSQEAIDTFFYFNTNDECVSPDSVSAISRGAKSYHITTKEAASWGEDVVDGRTLNGEKYKEKLCQLYPCLQKKGVPNDYSLLIDEKESPLSGWGCNTTYDCVGDDCAANFQFQLEGKIKDVAMYCNSFYDSYYKLINKNTDSAKARVRECISFDRYYTELVKGGYVQNLTDSCGGIFSPDTKELIESILDIIKIAGPILAILLGIIDFARAVVGGDADKELKDSGKRFLRRLLAAILLFLIPLILSLLMNLFLKNQPGYDKYNPFCDVGDWGKNEEIGE